MLLVPQRNVKAVLKPLRAGAFVVSVERFGYLFGPPLKRAPKGSSDLIWRLGVCAADRCDRVFVDVSRNAGKRFCSLSCQNRVKAAAFRGRR